jgi:hypothetical protein
MKNPSEEHYLLKDVLADAASEEFRSATLAQGLSLARRKRLRRRATRMGSLAASLIILLTMLSLFVHRLPTIPFRNGAPISGELRASAPKFVEGTSIRILSDAELLDLFKDRPVALIGPAGRQRLIMLDEISQ